MSPYQEEQFSEPSKSIFKKPGHIFLTPIDPTLKEQGILCPGFSA